MQFSKWVTLVFGALCLVAVAGVVGAQHLYYMAAILLTLPAISYGLGWLSLRHLQFHRELPHTAWEGEEGEIVYAAVNPTAVPRFFLTAQEALPRWIVSLDATPPLFNALARDTSRVVHRVYFRRRGVYQATHFDIVAMDPLGVFAFTKSIPCQGELIVYPTPLMMRSLPLSGSERYGWQEFTAQVLRGSSVDPDGVRAYVPGDPLRRIHWRQTARTGRLSVIEFEESQSINLVIAMDLMHGSDFGPEDDTTLEYAIRLAASLTQQAIQQGAGASLLLPHDAGGNAQNSEFRNAVSLSGRGPQQLYLILDALARVEAESVEPIQNVIEERLPNPVSGTSLLVLTARPDRRLAETLAHYTARGVHVVLVFVDPTTFPEGEGRLDKREGERFLTELSAVRVQSYRLPYHPDGYLQPDLASRLSSV